MDRRILETLTAVKDTYGDGVFYNLTTVRNLLADLAPGLRKERIQIANFLEIGGYFQLKYAEDTYPLVRARLAAQLTETFAVDESAAMWILDIFSELLGYNINDEGAVYRPESLGRIIQPAPSSERPRRPYVGGKERRPLMTVPRTIENEPVVDNFKLARRIAADWHSVAVMRNGQVKAVGLNSDGQCHTSTYDWRDIIAVSAGAYFTVGLRADGTVVGAGRYEYNQRNFTGWTNITAVSAGARHTTGLRADGTLLACGQNKHNECKVTHWRNIVRVAAGQDCTFGIKKDGRVLVSGDNKNGDLQVSHLENVADIAYASPGRILALHKDGTVSRVGRENHMRKTFAHLRGIRQISAAPDYFAALTEDGKVRLIAYFWQDSGVEAAVSSWKNIAAIAAGRYHILGLRSDGKLLAEMLHYDLSRNKGQLNVGNWEV